MTPAKEGAHAFMATSNDSMHTNGISPSDSSSLSPTSTPHPPRSNTLPRDSAVLSPPLHYEPSDELISPTDMSALPSRQQVPSASRILTSELHLPSDQTFWHSQYHRAIEIHEHERKLWNDEQQFLNREISWLREELNKKRSDSGVSYFGGKENDKVFADPEVVRKSHEKLRQFSNVSPLKDQNSNPGVMPVSRAVQDAPLGEDYGGRRQISSTATVPSSAGNGNRLPSITEGETTQPGAGRVSINEASTAIGNASIVETLNEENPASPPTTADVQTPPNSKLHAGRTPPIPRASNDALEDADEFVSSNYTAPRPHADFDDDPELNSPKMLPNVPSNVDVPELTDLNRRLEEVAANPADNPPEAVRSASTSPLPPASGTGQDEEIGGVKLKTKRSHNFGAPLGNLR